MSSCMGVGSGGGGGGGRKKTLWKISIPPAKVPPLVKKPHSKSMEKQELEKEWLLLGEPTSPCPQREPKTMESTILSDEEPTVRGRKRVIVFVFHLSLSFSFASALSLRILSIRTKWRTVTPTHRRTSMPSSMNIARRLR